MEVWQIIATLSIGLLSGFLTVTAGAAVTILIPVLLLIGLDANQANATSRVSLGIAGLVAGVMLLIRGGIDWPKMMPLLIAAGLGTAAGAAFGARVPADEMLTLIVITSAVSMGLVFIRPARWISAEPQRAVLSGVPAAAVLFLLCIYEGIVAVDSALLRLILLVCLLGYPIIQANPIKLFTGLVMFGVSSVVYAGRGEVDIEVAAYLAAGSIVGAVVAVPLSTSIRAQRPIYRMLQIIVSIETIWLIHHWWTSRPA